MEGASEAKEDEDEGKDDESDAGDVGDIGGEGAAASGEEEECLWMFALTAGIATEGCTSFAEEVEEVEEVRVNLEEMSGWMLWWVLVRFGLGEAAVTGEPPPGRGEKCAEDIRRRETRMKTTKKTRKKTKRRKRSKKRSRRERAGMEGMEKKGSVICRGERGERERERKSRERWKRKCESIPHLAAEDPYDGALPSSSSWQQQQASSLGRAALA